MRHFLRNGIEGGLDGLDIGGLCGPAGALALFQRAELSGAIGIDRGLPGVVKGNGVGWET